jgi:transmembrane sensor
VMDDPAVAQALADLPPFPANDQAEAQLPRRRLMPMAAALAALAIGLGAWNLARPQPATPLHFATAQGQVASSRLSDGSLVQLDPASTLDVTLSPQARQLHLASGRALFDVAHAPERPFTVQGGTMAVTAIGTVFSVDTSAMGTSLRVEQGRVRVMIEGRSQPIFVKAGEGLNVDAGKALHTLHFRADPAAASDTAWLMADGEPLAQVVARLQRRAAFPLSLAPELADRPMHGRYSSADPLGSLRLIALAHGWQVQAQGSGWRLAR